MPTTRATVRKRRRVERSVAFHGMEDSLDGMRKQLDSKRTRIASLEAEVEEYRSESAVLRSQLHQWQRRPQEDPPVGQPISIQHLASCCEKSEVMSRWRNMLDDKLAHTNKARLQYYRPPHRHLPHPKELWEQMTDYLDRGVGSYFGVEGEARDKDGRRTFQPVEKIVGPPL